MEGERLNTWPWWHRPQRPPLARDRRWREPHLDALKLRMGELDDLRHMATLADWDQQTQMPRGGGEARAEAMATMERIAHELFIDDETGRELEGAAAELDGADPDSDDARLVRLVSRQYAKARRVPAELAADLARASSIGQEIWVRRARTLTSPPSRRLWSATSSSSATTSSVISAPASTSVPTTWCSTTTSPR